MSGISTSSSSILSLQQLPNLQLATTCRFTNFVHNLLVQLRQEDTAEHSLLLDKTSKTHPIVVVRRGAAPTETALAIDKVYSLMKKNLGFLINSKDRQIAETPRRECFELIEKCKDFAVRLTLSENLTNLEKLERKISQIIDSMDKKEKIFLYRFIGTNRSILAFMSSWRDPQLIQASKNFWRRCVKADYVEFSEIWEDKNGRIPENQDLNKLFRELSFPLIPSVLTEKSFSFTLNSGLRLVEPVWRFIELHSSRLELQGIKTLSGVARNAFLQVLEFLLYPKRHPISWDSSVGLWDTSKKLGINKVETECLLWLKNEMELYSSYPEDMKERVFDRVISWHQDALARYQGYYPPMTISREEYQEFFAEIVQSAKGLAEFTRVLDCFIEKKIDLDRLSFSSGLSQAHYEKLSSLSTLKKLSLEGISLVDADVKILATLKLTELSFDDATCLTEGGFWHLSKMFTLEKMSVRRLPPYLTDTGLRCLSRLPLQAIDLSGCVLITNAGLSALKGPIKELSFGGSKYLTPSVLTDLVGLPLEKLTLFRIPELKTYDLAVLAFSSVLTSLEIIDNYPTKTTDPIISLLAARYPRLTRLHLESIGLTNREMSFFHGLPLLEKLTLCRVSIDSLGSVTNLSNLTHLGLLECNLIKGRSLRTLKSVTSLKLLEVSGKGIEEASLPDILSLTQLTSLNLVGCAVSNTRMVKDCLEKARNLKILRVSNLFFNVFQHIARGTRFNVFPFIPDQFLQDLVLDKKKLWELALKIEERIPLDYFSLLLREEPKEWVSKVSQDLKNRINVRHNFVSEDFQKAIELMSYAINKPHLELAKNLWELFFRPKVFGYDSPREVDKIHNLDANLWGWIHRRPASGPDPLEVIRFLLHNKPRFSNGYFFLDPLQIGEFVLEALEQYKALLPPVVESEVTRLEISRNYPLVSLAFSNLLSRLVVMKFLGGAISPLLTAFCSRLNQYYERRSSEIPSYDEDFVVHTNLGSYYGSYEEKIVFGEDHESFIADIAEMISLIVFSRKYELEELERVSSNCLIRHLSSSEYYVKQKGLKEVLKILLEAKLFKLNLYANIPLWLLHGLELEESLQIVRH